MRAVSANFDLGVIFDFLEAHWASIITSHNLTASHHTFDHLYLAALPSVRGRQLMGYEPFQLLPALAYFSNVALEFVVPFGSKLSRSNEIMPGGLESPLASLCIAASAGGSLCILESRSLQEKRETRSTFYIL